MSFGNECSSIKKKGTCSAFYGAFNTFTAPSECVVVSHTSPVAVHSLIKKEVYDREKTCKLSGAPIFFFNNPSSSYIYIFFVLSSASV